MDCLTADFEKNVRTLDALLGVGRCFDMISRDLYVGGKRARLWVVDGYGDDAVIERMLSFWLPLRNIDGAQTMQQFIDRYITFSEVNAEQSVETAVTSVFLGKLLLLIDGFDACALIDAKQFPARSVEEPSAGKVLRGAHDGFIETLVANAALLRRRIRESDRKIKSFGNVDMGVLSEDQNLKDRLAFLGEQLDDVRSSMSEIERLITDADAMAHRQFTEALVRVDGRFCDIFSKLLGGGKTLLLGDLIEMQFYGNSYNPYLGSAIALVMMVIVLICMAIMNRFGDGKETAVLL